MSKPTKPSWLESSEQSEHALLLPIRNMSTNKLVDLLDFMDRLWPSLLPEDGPLLAEERT